MDAVLIASLLAACGALMLVERSGVRTTLNLHFKGDLKRETGWFAQYGQAACSPVVFLLVWDLDARGLRVALPIGLAVALAAVVALVVKRAVGRVRPGRENAGQFLGPTLRHASHRESFPSSHTACAVALSGMLARVYPEASLTFWALAGVCGALRYLLDAHWPSDIVAGFVVGYISAEITASAARL